MTQTERKKKANLYLFSEWYQTPEEEVIKDPKKPGVIIGTVERTAAHRDGKWHGCAWIILFRDSSLDEILVQERTAEKMGGGIVGTRKTLSAAGHIDERIRLKNTDRIPYTGRPHKAAYAEFGQECFYERELPEDLVLVELGYIRNKDRRIRKPLIVNREHVWIYTGIYPTASKRLNFDPHEAKEGYWCQRKEIDEIIENNNVHQRRKHVTDELVRTLSFLNTMEKEAGGRDALSKYIQGLLVAEHDRIAEYRRGLYLQKIGHRIE